MKDRHIKYPKYEAEGIPYYLIVDVESQTVEIYQLVNDKYQRQPLLQREPYMFIFSHCRFDVLFDLIWE